MDKFIAGFIQRNFPQFFDNFDVIITNEKVEKYEITAKDNAVSEAKYYCEKWAFNG